VCLSFIWSLSDINTADNDDDLSVVLVSRPADSVMYHFLFLRPR